MPPFEAALCRGGIHPSLNHGDSSIYCSQGGRLPSLTCF